MAQNDFSFTVGDFPTVHSANEKIVAESKAIINAYSSANIPVRYDLSVHYIKNLAKISVSQHGRHLLRYPYSSHPKRDYHNPI